MVDMGNTLNIAKKEFQDLISSKMILVILASYFIIVLLSAFCFNSIITQTAYPQVLFNDSVGIAAANFILSTLVSLGPITSIMFGGTSIASERHGNALNTLLAKPLYRDTIITGKFLGSMLFLLLVVIAVIIFFTSGMLVFCGSSFVTTFNDYITQIPAIIILSMIMLSMFLLMSMLISILVKNQSFSLIISAFILYLISISTTSNFSRPISKIFPENESYIKNLILDLSPRGFADFIDGSLFSPSMSALDTQQVIIPYVLKFLLYIAVLGILCYVTFIRSDVS